MLCCIQWRRPSSRPISVPLPLPEGRSQLSTFSSPQACGSCPHAANLIPQPTFRAKPWFFVQIWAVLEAPTGMTARCPLFRLASQTRPSLRPAVEPRSAGSRANAQARVEARRARHGRRRMSTALARLTGVPRLPWNPTLLAADPLADVPAARLPLTGLLPPCLGPYPMPLS